VLSNNKIDTSNWIEYRVGDIFEITTTKHISKENIVGDGKILTITGGKCNYGISGYYGLDKEYTLEEKNCITFCRTSCDCFYRDQKFIGIDSVACLRHEKLNKTNAQFLCSIFGKENNKYSFGRKRLANVLVDERIKLPSKLNSEGKYEPNWQYMEDFIKQKEKGIEDLKYVYTRNQSYPQIRKGLEFCLNNNERIRNILNKDVKNEKLDTSDWKEYKISDLFSINLATRVIQEQLIDTEKNKKPYITRSIENNGCSGYYSNEATEKGNALIIGTQGATVFYQKDDFITGADIRVLRNENLTKNIGLYLATIININSKKKFKFGYECNSERISNMSIKLPSIIHEDGSYEPDWGYMESYIKKFLE